MKVTSSSTLRSHRLQGRRRRVVWHATRAYVSFPASARFKPPATPAYRCCARARIGSTSAAPHRGASSRRARDTGRVGRRGGGGSRVPARDRPGDRLPLGLGTRGRAVGRGRRARALRRPLARPDAGDATDDVRRSGRRRCRCSTRRRPSWSARQERTRTSSSSRCSAWRIRRLLRDVEAATLAALEQRGEATARQLVADVPALGEKVRVNVGKRYEGDLGLSSRVLPPARARREIVRAPRRTARGQQPVQLGAGGELARASHAGLVAGRGPRRARARAGSRASGPAPRPTSTGGRAGPLARSRRRWPRSGRRGRPRRCAAAVVLPDDLEPTPAPDPWVGAAPVLDPTTMGWQARDWYPRRRTARALFDTNGNAGPTIWADGRIVGGWASDAAARSSRSCSRTSAARLQRRWTRRPRARQSCCRASRSVPRFPVPLHRRLLA